MTNLRQHLCLLSMSGYGAQAQIVALITKSKREFLPHFPDHSIFSVSEPNSFQMNYRTFVIGQSTKL
jgi:hypothetical protein